MLTIIYGFGKTATEAVADAVRIYNETPGDKQFHARETYWISDAREDLPHYYCEVWFTLIGPPAETTTSDTSTSSESRHYIVPFRGI